LTSVKAVPGLQEACCLDKRELEAMIYNTIMVQLDVDT